MEHQETEAPVEYTTTAAEAPAKPPKGYCYLPDFNTMIPEDYIIGVTAQLARKVDMSINRDTVGPLTVSGADTVITQITVHLSSDGVAVLESSGAEVVIRDDDSGIGQVSFCATKIALNRWENTPIEDTPAFQRLANVSEKNRIALDTKLASLSADITDYYAIANEPTDAEVMEGLEGLSMPDETQDRAAQLRLEAQNRAKENAAKETLAKIAGKVEWFEAKVLKPWARKMETDYVSVGEILTAVRDSGDMEAADTIQAVVTEDVLSALR